MKKNKKKFLWVFGNAVQDVTVSVDIERLSRELGSNRDAMIRLSDQGPEINPNIWLKTQIGLQNFAIQLQLKPQKPPLQKNTENWYILEGGKKYTLQNDIETSNKYSSSNGSPELLLPCGNLSWGGGGANVVTFLRAIAPNTENVPIKYTDIAMSRSLPALVQMVKKIFNSIGDSGDAIANLYDTDLVAAEKYTADLAKIVAGYAPECSLEVYLASLPVESVLYRPKEPKFRRNWVFSRFRSASREVSNKIILRGSSSDLKKNEKQRISELLKASAPGVGAILLNSIKDKTLFQATYTIYKDAYESDNTIVAILAMTDAMQEFTQWMLEKPNCDSNGLLLPFILVFNETEAYRFAEKLGGKFKPFMKGDGLPNIKEFATLVTFLRSKFDSLTPPRIYVTLGSRGSLGVDSSGHVIYITSFSKEGATIYDTNACGDAYCAAIALLEWAKRHSGQHNIAGVNFNDPLAFAKEMEHFMAVATAAAYCKATNRRGRVYATDLKDLLQYNHLASAILPALSDLVNITPNDRPECVDKDFYLREPSQANFPGITEGLSDLIG